MKKKEILIFSVVALILLFGLIASFFPRSSTLLGIKDDSNALNTEIVENSEEQTNTRKFYDAVMAKKYQNCNENYTGGNTVALNSEFKYGGKQIVKLQTNAPVSKVVNNIQVYYVTEDTFTLKLENIYSLEDKKDVSNGYWLSDDSQKKVLGRDLGGRLGNGGIIIETAKGSDMYIDVLEPIKGSPFQNTGASFDENIGLYTMSGDDLNRGIKIRVTFCYQLGIKEEGKVLGVFPVIENHWYRFKEIYEFYVVKDTNNVQILNEDSKDESNIQNPTKEEQFIDEFGQSLGNNSTVNSAFSLRLRVRDFNYPDSISSMYNPSTLLINVLELNDFVNFNRIKIEHSYRNGPKNILVDYNSKLNDFKYQYGEDNNPVTIQWEDKVLNEKTKETAKFVKLTFSGKGKHELIFTSASGKTKTVVIYVFNKVVNKEEGGTGYGIYFGTNIFIGDKASSLSVIPAFRNSVKIKIEEFDTSLYPKLYVEEWFSGVGEKKLYCIEGGTELEFTEPGSYVLTAINGDIEAGGSFCKYTIKFEIVTKSPPQINKNIIDELYAYSRIASEVYEVKYKTESGYYAKVIFGLDDYDLAVDYAYELEKLQVESHLNEGYYLYKGDRYEDAVELTEKIQQIAKDAVKQVKFDYGFEYDNELLNVILSQGADIRNLVLEKDTYVMTASAFDNLFTEDVILTGDFKFIKTAEYDSNKIVAKHTESGKITDISYEKPLKEQLNENGLYLITETNCYPGEITTYFVKYYGASEFELVYQRGYEDENGVIKALENLIVNKLTINTDLNYFIKLTNKTTNEEKICLLEDFNQIVLNVGEYEIYCAVQTGEKKTYYIEVKEIKEPSNPPKDETSLLEKFFVTTGGAMDSAVDKVGSAIGGIGNAVDSAVDTVKDFFKRLF